MARDFVCLYHSYLEAIEALGDAERGRLMTAMLEYSQRGATGELGGNERYIWPMIRSQIDRDASAYERKCETNRANKRSSTIDNERQRPITNVDKEEEEGKGKREGKDGTRTARFTPPSVEDVAAYCRERSNGIDAQQFIDHYEANGWRRGKTPIKDWKACVRTWEKSDQRKTQRQEEYDPYAGMQWF